MSLFTRVEKLRKKENISQGKLEELLGFSNGSINKWKTSMPKADRLQKIADYFGVTVDYLLSGNDDNDELLDVADEIQKLINYLTDDKSSYCYGEVMSEEGKLALLNSLKQDKEFLTALYKKEENK